MNTRAPREPVKPRLQKLSTRTKLPREKLNSGPENKQYTFNMSSPQDNCRYMYK